jgi:3-hydroxyacyl-CoA dehydrogenase/enoyl-CoA hydratase/carnithine racemase
MSASAATPPSPPAEVVTHAISHDVELPGGAGTMVLITLDNHAGHRRPNSFGQAGLAELDAAIATALARPDAVAVGVTGKPYSFSAGADVTSMPFVTTREQALAISQRGHEVYGRISTATKPTFAFVNGLALGGGLELALHCRYRTVATNVPALGLPEAFLGLVPGWGGAYLLPQLIGVEKALGVMVSNPLQNNRLLTGAEAFDLGIADAAFEPADFLERSLEWAADVVAGRTPVVRPEAVTDPRLWAGVIGGARALLAARTHGAAPAPERVIDLVAAGPSSDPVTAYAAEDEALSELLLSPQFRAGIYAFDLTQRRAKRPVGAPDVSTARPVTKIGVVGGGLMGRQLALLFARRLQVPVVIADLDDERVGAAVAGVADSVARTVARKRMSAGTAARIVATVSGTVDLAELADADLVIEAVVERSDVKASVFAELEGHVRPDCLLVTNTSGLSVGEMAAGLELPERVVGLHFFNPVSAMPLVEVVRAERTDDVTLATAFSVATSLQKTPILCADAPAFVVNRILTSFMGSVLGTIDQGADIAVADAALDRLGLPMSPLELVELVGPAVALHVGQTCHDAWPDRFGVSALLAGMVERGITGAWERAGDPRDPRTALAPKRLRADVSALMDDLRAGGAIDSPAVAPSADDVRTATLTAVTDEIGRLLDEGVVGDVRDVDLALILGAGWPFWLGGISPYLDREGYSEAVRGKRFLPPGVASLPA